MSRSASKQPFDYSAVAPDATAIGANSPQRFSPSPKRAANEQTPPGSNPKALWNLGIELRRIRTCH
jgi:hypothetical protein